MLAIFGTFMAIVCDGHSCSKVVHVASWNTDNFNLQLLFCWGKIVTWNEGALLNTKLYYYK